MHPHNVAWKVNRTLCGANLITNSYSHYKCTRGHNI